MLTVRTPLELGHAVQRYALHYRGGYLVVKLDADLRGGHLHQDIGDDLGRFTITPLTATATAT